MNDVTRGLATCHVVVQTDRTGGKAACQVVVPKRRRVTDPAEGEGSVGGVPKRDRAPQAGRDRGRRFARGRIQRRLEGIHVFPKLCEIDAAAHGGKRRQPAAQAEQHLARPAQIAAFEVQVGNGHLKQDAVQRTIPDRPCSERRPRAARARRSSPRPAPGGSPPPRGHPAPRRRRPRSPPDRGATACSDSRPGRAPRNAPRGRTFQAPSSRARCRLRSST